MATEPNLYHRLSVKNQAPLLKSILEHAISIIDEPVILQSQQSQDSIIKPHIGGTFMDYGVDTICSQHNKKTGFYCVNDEQCLCFQCVLEHTGHSIEKYENIEKNTQMLENHLQQCKDLLKFISNTEWNTVLDQYKFASQQFVKFQEIAHNTISVVCLNTISQVNAQKKQMALVMNNSFAQCSDYHTSLAKQWGLLQKFESKATLMLQNPQLLKFTTLQQLETDFSQIMKTSIVKLAPIESITFSSKLEQNSPIQIIDKSLNLLFKSQPFQANDLLSAIAPTVQSVPKLQLPSQTHCLFSTVVNYGFPRFPQ